MVIDAWSRYFVELLSRFVCQLTISLHAFLRMTFHVIRPRRNTNILGVWMFFMYPRGHSRFKYGSVIVQYICLFHIVLECTRSIHDQGKMLVLPNRTTGSSILDHDFGHLCRGRRIHMSGHSDFVIFSNFRASSIFDLGISRYCVSCVSCATQQSGDDIHDFCCCHL